MAEFGSQLISAKNEIMTIFEFVNDDENDIPFETFSNLMMELERV